MPQMTGLELMREAQLIVPGLPVVLFSASSPATIPQGAAACISKENPTALASAVLAARGHSSSV